jgi:carbonic anhydrase
MPNDSNSHNADSGTMGNHMDNTSGTSRRKWFQLVGVAAAGTIAVPSWRPGVAAEPTANPRTGLTAEVVLADLMGGNERFVAGRPDSPRRRPEEYGLLATAQFPEAAIIACSDSRVPPEILFDQGVGDLFVIRVAGNVIADSGAVVKGSIEYAVAVLKVPLVMVLGHSNCGAVKAAIDLAASNEPLPGAIDGLVRLIKPAVESSAKEPGDKLTNAIRANVELGVERLHGLDPIVAEAVRGGKLKLVGATYDLASGRVKLLT